MYFNYVERGGGDPQPCLRGEPSAKLETTVGDCVSIFNDTLNIVQPCLWGQKLVF